MGKECYCSSGMAFNRCCERYLNDSEIPETAEQLMRSRYTAYALQDEAYLIKTWHSTSCPTNKPLGEAQHKWHRLKVKEVLMGGVDDVTGEVAFEAVYKINGKAHKHIERSLFEKEEGVWRYLDVKKSGL